MKIEKNKNRAWQIHLTSCKIMDDTKSYNDADIEKIWKLANQIRIASTELYSLLAELEEN